MYGRLIKYSRKAHTLALVVLFGLVTAVYLPGIGGPWLFDDYSNLVQNNFLRISDLRLETLTQASYSLASGPLQRPVAMLSFALNYYFSGSFEHALPFKLTNIIIHAINGILVFMLVQLMLDRQSHPDQSTNRSWRYGIQRETAMALTVALLWVVHPIQVSSVLYVVQRMTELATFFMLLSLICYFLARRQLAHRHYRRLSFAVLLVASAGFWILGMLSKENAAILPVVVLILEYAFFSNEPPWHIWNRLSPRLRIFIAGFGALLGIAAIYLVIRYALPGYANRPFTMPERLLTEARVLFFYLYLILVPQIDLFTLYHDDLVISTSLFSPWTTASAVVGHVALLLFTIGLLWRRKQPLLALGIAWFYVGHAIESSVIPLELMHEHRNYFPSLGIFLAIVELIRLGARQFNLPKLAWCLPIFFVFFSFITVTRANQWSSSNTFYAYELIHHPHSAMANSGLAGVLTKMGRLQDAESALRMAAEIQPNEPSHRIWILTVQAQGGQILDQQVQQQILRLLAEAPLTATTIKTLGDVAGCLATWCNALSTPMNEWLDVLLQRKQNAGDKSYYYYLLGIALVNQGKTAESISAFWKSHEMDPQYLHPLFGLANVHLQLKDLNNAEGILCLLQKWNENNPYAMPEQVKLVAAEIEQLRNSRPTSLHNRK
jgi:tetratricopeptide (TPR) repeat protein